MILVSLALFGEDFMKFKSFITEGYFLSKLRGRVGPSDIGKAGDWEFKVGSIELLSDLRDKLAKCITIQLPLDKLDDMLMEEIQILVEDNKASTEHQNCALNFLVFDQERNVRVELPSKTIKINPTNKFLEQLKGLHVVNYKLN